MKKIYILILSIFIIGPASAQQHPMISQYMFNGLFLNPGYAGSHKFISSTLHHRSQWAGFEGAPKTSIIAIDGMLTDNKNAVGGILSHDRIGITTETDLLLNYAFHIQTGKDKRLSLGLRGGMSYYTANINELTVWDNDDDLYYNQNISSINPKAGVGVYFYTPSYFAGISIPTLLASEPDKGFNLDLNKSSDYRRHYFLSGGYIQSLSENIRMRPSMLIKYLAGAPAQFDFNLSFLLNETIWIGTSYRTSESIIGLVEYHTNFGMRIGYAFDYNISPIRRYSYGSHEILIGYEIGRDNGALKTPRFF